MKRKLFLTSVVIALSVLFFGAVNACAETYLGLSYTKSNNSIEISSCLNKDVTALDIPSEIDGVPVTSIGSQAFKNCSNLQILSIPESITKIGSSAFYGCTGLTKVNISNIDAWFNINFHTHHSNPLFYAHSLYLDNKLVTKLDVPDTIDKINKYTFYGCTSIEEVYIPEGISSIEYNAFRDCTNLTSISIPSSLTYIGTASFENCTGLERVDINSIDSWLSIEFEDYLSNPLKYAHKLYLNNNPVTSVSVPNSITEIKAFTFNNCTTLEEVYLPDSVTSIGFDAFSYCSNLKKINIPASITSIGSGAFLWCSKLSRVDINSIESWLNISFADESSNPLHRALNLYLDGEIVEHLLIPSSITEIKDYAFYNCQSLERITIPSNLTKIGSYAFSYCSNITKVNISDLDAWCKISFENSASNPLSYGKNLYLDEQLVEEVIFQDTEIKPLTFIGCSSLKVITIPYGVVSIGACAFSDCDNLTSVYMPDSVLTIGAEAFSNCDNLTSVHLSNNITSISDSLFRHCNKLESISLHDKITSIGEYAFYDCQSLTSIKIPENITTINDSTFGECISLSSIKLPKGITSIKDSAFIDCISLAKINIPDSVTSIGNFAFAYCRNLTDATLSNNLSSVGRGCFAGCYNLDSITLSNNISKINLETFDACTKLSNILFYGTEEQFSEIAVSNKNEPFLNATVHYLPFTDTTVSESGKKFTVAPGNVGKNIPVILALYNNGKFVGLQTAIYEGENLTFETDLVYTDAKVMVWNDEDSINPITYVEKVK